MVNQIRWFIGLDPSETVQKGAEHASSMPTPPSRTAASSTIPRSATSQPTTASAHHNRASATCYKGAVVLPKATKTPHIQQNAELDFEISAADIAVLKAMRDTENHEDPREFRWT
jgi:hypothetical protein